MRYDIAGPLTALGPGQIWLVDALPDDPAGACAAVAALVVAPDVGPPERFAEREIRQASAIVDVLRSEQQVIGTCRHRGVVAVAVLRHRGVAARARCGFASYFGPDKWVDHWVVEHRDGDRWRRIDGEAVGTDLVERPDDLGPAEFLTGGEAWTRWRAGTIDPLHFGVPGTAHAWGIGEIRGNAIRDLAALCSVETLPWDEWGGCRPPTRARPGR